MDTQTRDAPLTAHPKNSPRKAVLERFDLSPTGLHKVVREGRFPAPFYVGGKPLWREADLQAVEAGHWSTGMRAEAAQAAALAHGQEARQAKQLPAGAEARRAAAPTRRSA